MKLNEHKSKILFSRYNIPVPEGYLVLPAEVENFSPEFAFPWVIKAQVLTGGRGKAGGIKVVNSRDEFIQESKRILNLEIKSEKPPFLRIERGVNIQREIYLSFTVHRKSKSIVFSTGREGGINIEESSKDNLLIQHLDNYGLQDYHIKNSFFHLQLDKSLYKKYYQLLKNIFLAFKDNKALLLEINPLVLTKDKEFIALDGKVELDDSFVSINSSLEEYYTPEHKSELENLARKYGLSFHQLDGFVGMIVNGAGLAMATMDLLNFAGLKPANFLDLGGGATPERIKQAFSILFADPKVQIIFINIFGGILSCDRVASALSKVLTSPPPKEIVIRFSGFKNKEAKEIIKNLNYPQLFLADDLEEAIKLLKYRLKIEKDFNYQKTTNQEDVILTPQNNDTTFPLNENSQILVQGITGKEGSLHTEQMLKYGTKIVAGVTPFKEGETVQGIPVFNSVKRACANFKIDASIIFVPAAFAVDAILEAVEEKIPFIICITENIPQQDMLGILPKIKSSSSVLIGPNTPGLIVPGKLKVGIMPADIFRPGQVAIFSRSGTLTYECVNQLSKSGIGQSLCVGIGGDPFIGSEFKDLIKFIEKDPQTKALLILGEIGGTAEEDLSYYLKERNFSKPCFAFIAGQTAPPGKRLGHAGAILEKGKNSLEDKINTLKQNGFIFCSDLSNISETIRSNI